jgi:predicted AAA+ superfamily ATPase
MESHMTIKRLLNMELPKKQSAFLWGARKTGKSTYLAERFKDSIYIDLLKTDELTRFLSAPHLLREELSDLSENKRRHPIIIDEIQKVPLLLNEVHWLIENQTLSFILCGSSARKLKRGAANLLGGRAWRFNFYPLVYKEIHNFDLLRALNHGLIPSHYLSNQPNRMLRAYIADYLIEEIQAGGIVRNLPAFARFMDLVAFTNGQMLNYTNIARDCGVDAKTVKEYYQIMQDTLIGYLIDPFHKIIKRDLIQSTPKFYLFDIGVTNHLQHKKISILKGEDAGNAFENYILMELMAFYGLHELDNPINYWRTKTGLEVDFILNQGKMAIDVKIDKTPDKTDIKGLLAYCEDYQPQHAIVVCTAPRRRILATVGKTLIVVLPWQEFLENLWNKMYL